MWVLITELNLMIVHLSYNFPTNYKGEKYVAL